MAPQSLTLAARSITANKFAPYVSRNVVTVRKWFENDPQVIRTPRGRQRDQISIPIDYAVTRCRQMGIPEDIIQRMLNDHQRQCEALPTAKLSPPPVARMAPKRETSKNGKLGKPKPKTKSRRG
jgi:hypothetical protein